ncbi:hypothetical protein FHQ18_10060 [Deferribacter autotrophicus]|uniref:Uncharacterized protein n=1 Tax=Deferribacter autotrophicus TaxID=500465 RepID=A0A5A8F1W1_9BACT|nr:hypothetical protein [Deferribacter autotrophicus]KAA0257382.1 hypothetical protein FHQ18_10060 [Deferribacter autotrophicus]
MKRFKTISKYLFLLLFFYIITNVFDGFLGLIQYPILILIASKRINIININETDIILSLFSDYINDLFFGVSLLVFFILKFLFSKYLNLFYTRKYYIFLGKVAVLLVFIGFVFLYYHNNNITLLFEVLLVNSISMLLLNFVLERYFV